MISNRTAFLETIAISEGTSTSPATKNRGYDVIVTGIDGKPEVFTDYGDHPFANGRPPKVINSRGLRSTASGRYQFLEKDWKYYRTVLKLANFGPVSQDLWAIQLIRERGALALIDGGSFATAVARCSNLWASLPGPGSVAYGQPTRQISLLQSAFIKAGGTVAA